MKRVFLFFPLLSTTAWADNASLYDGSEIVVTASRIAEPISSAVNDVTVIGQDEIARSGQSTLTELLQFLPGIEITANGGLGQPSAVQIRGAGSSHTLVLLDGMRIDSATTGTTAFQNIPLDQIDHIEIVRGPASGLYGSEAIGGVIQIFTKQAQGNGFSASAGYGGYDTSSMSAGFQAKSARQSFDVNAGYLQSGGFPATRPGNFSYNSANDAYRNANMAANYALQVSPDDEVGIKLFQSDGNTQFADTQVVGLDHEVISSYSAYDKYRFSSDWQSTLTAGSSEDHLVASGNYPGYFTTNQNQFSWQNDFSLKEGTITAGLEELDQHVTSDTAYAVTSRTISSAFAGYQGNFSGHHFLQADMRVDRNSQFGTYRTGNAGYAYQIDPRYKVRIDTGTAFKAPTFNDLYYPGFSNPNLLPERSTSREVGLDYASGSRHVGLTYFDNHIRDMIILDQFFVPQNIDSARIHGVELAYQESFSDYKIDCGLTVQNPVDSQTGFMLQRHARQFGSVKLSRNMGDWRTGVEWFASGYRYDSVNQDPATRLGGYNFLNLTASRDLSKKWRLDARWNNLFNKRYELVQYYNTPGSNLFVSLTYKM